MDAELVRRIARGERLDAVTVSALLTIAVGAGAYGAAFGCWRGAAQAFASAIKLPAVLFALAIATVALASMLALLLHAPLRPRQSAVCILVGLATTAGVLGALAPVSAGLALAIAPPDAGVLGLSPEDPRAIAASVPAQALLLWNVGVIALAGVLGNLRLLRLLRELCRERELAVRVLLAWLAIEFFVGGELSWIARPFLGRANDPVTFLADGALHGTFFEGVWDALSGALGARGALALAVALASLAAAMWTFARPDGLPVKLAALPHGLAVTGSEARWSIAWPDVRAVFCREGAVYFADVQEVVVDVVTGPARRLLVRFESEEPAEHLRVAIETERTRAIGPGPYRSTTARA